MSANPLTMEEERKAWTISRSLNGITYYYNRATKKSQYEMPDCFKTTEEKLEHPEWKEYRTAEGKKFYYNSRTTKSVWQLPSEVKEWRLRMEEEQRLERELQKKKEEAGLLTPNDINRKKFMMLLKDKRIDVMMKWDHCIKLCEDDQRWSLSLTMNEKKSLFFDYISELKKIENKERRAKLDLQRAAFLKLLTENKNLNSDSKMHKMLIELAGDPRWKNLDEEERESVYQSYMDELYNKEKEEAKEKKKYYMDALGKEMEERQVSFKMRWDDFRAEFADSPNFKYLHNTDRLNKFVEYILEAEKKAEEHLQTEKVNRWRQNRENFRELLLVRLRDGKIDHKTRWAGFVKSNLEDSAMVEMMDPDQKGSSAHELFEDLMEGIRDNHKALKGEIKQHFKTEGFKISPDTSQDQFEERLKGLSRFWDLRPVTRDYFYYYFKNKIRNKTDKRTKKDKKVLAKIFKNIKEVKPKASVSSLLPKIRAELKDELMSDETITKHLEKYLKDLDETKRKKRSRSKDSRSDSESSEERRKRKRHERSSSGSDSSRNKKPEKKVKKEEKPRNSAKKVEEERLPPVKKMEEEWKPKKMEEEWRAKKMEEEWRAKKMDEEKNQNDNE